jgi:hypothetical protein
LTIEFTRTQQSNNPCNIERSTFDIVHACVAQSSSQLARIELLTRKIILKTLN